MCEAPRVLLLKDLPDGCARGGEAVLHDEHTGIRTWTRAARAWASISPVTFLLPLVLPAAARGQDPPFPSSAFRSSTCGWLPHEASPSPAIVVRIQERIGNADGYVPETARDGLAALLRWVRDCDETASRQAVLELRRAYDRASSDPTYQAALGVALARGIEVQPPGAQGFNYRPAYEKSNSERQARRLLSDALEGWHSPGLGRELAGLGLATRDETTLEVAADALAQLAKQNPSDASVWTVRAEVAIARKRYDEAAETAAEAAELGDPAGFRALGVVRLLGDDDPALGGEMYLQGLSNADAGTLARYFEDIAPLLLLDDLREWAGLDEGQRRLWLRRELEWRASTAGRTVAERLAVHFQRLETAIDRFRRHAHRGARPPDAIVWDSLYLRLPYDDRGLIHIRHGEPDEIVRAPSGRSGPGKEAWVYYQLNGGRAVFEFRLTRTWADYVMALPAECDPFGYMYGVGGAAGEVRFNANTPMNTAWLEEFERGVLDYGIRLGVADPALAIHVQRCYTAIRRPGRLAEELPYIRLIEAARRRAARTGVDEALSSESAAPRFENYIQALSSVYAFRGRDNATDIAAFLLLPARQISPRQLNRGVAYPLRLSLAIEDPVAQQVQRTDTLLAFTAPQVLEREDQYLRTALQMRAEPVENATVRITVLNQEHPDEGQILVGTKTVPAYPPGEWAMSDLVIAAAQPGAWRRGGVAISPLPGHQLAHTERFRLFYEVYGLEPGQSIRTQITIAPGTDAELLSRLKALFGSERVLELRFEETAWPGPDGTLQVERTVLPSLEPGRYTLQVEIELPTGEVVGKETSVLFLERGS